MKKFLVLVAVSIFLVGSIFSQNNPNTNLTTKQRQQIIERTPDIIEQRSQIEARDQMKLNDISQEIEPISVTGVIKNVVERDFFKEISVEIEDETYLLKIPHHLISDIKPEETIELTGFKITINDYSFFKPLEIKYQEKTINMEQRKEKFQAHKFEDEMRSYLRDMKHNNFEMHYRFYNQPQRNAYKK